LHVKNYFYPWSSFIKSVTTVCNSLLKVIDENFSRTRSHPAFPKRSASSGSFTNLLRVAIVCGSRFIGCTVHRNPVEPCKTVSLGPPESNAITARDNDIASIGTIPKCSLSGV
uniref:Secreted protein n=1 Tax=Schistosoma curassoni TaxID=6186 RepID=A0A183JHA9_9TREM